MPRETKDRLGNRYGRLVVIDSIYIRGLGTGWKCLCDCGNELYASGTNLSTGNTTSCGCALIEARITHGQTSSKAYSTWKGMRRRCNRPTAPEYKNYGGRGIKVCERWEKFENFLEDMGHPPDGYWIERIDNNGNYEPENCKWESPRNQLSNRRNNRILEGFGKKQTVTRWAEEFEMPVTTLRNRVDRMGLSLEQAIEFSKHKET